LSINEHIHNQGGKEGGGQERWASYMEQKRAGSRFIRFSRWMVDAVDRPVTWFRENIVVPGQKTYPWYHEKLPRVPTIDKCHVDDYMCFWEANMQYKRDRLVDSEILNILRYRMDDCVREEYPDYEKCFPLKHDYENAAAAWFSKYGDQGPYTDVRIGFMKQKHRLLWERRHGKVGCGMRKSDDDTVSADPHE